MILSFCDILLDFYEDVIVDDVQTLEVFNDLEDSVRSGRELYALPIAVGELDGFSLEPLIRCNDRVFRSFTKMNMCQKMQLLCFCS